MKLVTLAFLAAGILCNSTWSVAQSPVPFKALMQQAGAQPAIPSKPDPNGTSFQPTTPKPADHGKAERVTGAVLLGAGAATITATLVVVGALHGSAGHPGRVWAGVGGGSGMAGVGITLIVLGNHKKSSN